ncbi:MAG: hypothetical protein DMG16_29370 [Acidobacteria bacterium]|nr:MAG: hypothetical protein DMG16_29370 [Acidobacteriota bacterium]
MNKTLMCGLLAGCLLLTAAWADPILTLNPANGVISGLPGTTVGWGFTFTNDTNYAVITGSQFCASTSSPLPDICFPLAPNLGTYADFAGAQFLVAGSSPENSVISKTFDDTALTGIVSFDIDPGDSGTASGIIVLTYDLFSVSPNDPAFSSDDELSSGNYLTAAASVTAVPVTAVPEPASLSLLGAAWLVVVLGRIKSYVVSYTSIC